MPTPRSPLKVFLADDSDLVRTRVAAMLGAPCMSIVGQASSAPDATEGILATHPDVVVLDVQLKGGTGLQVLQAVRKVDPSVAFIVFSNSSGPEYRKRYLQEGAARFLDKSTEFDQLPQAVATVRTPPTP